ncbi:MAG: hypothetical protein ACE5OZ_01030 [Candidatus Heimdallarchaeota archaeon]
MFERTRLRIIAKQDRIFCQLCGNEVEDPSEAETCPNCRMIFHYAHLAEFVKTKGSCPTCEVELSFLPDLPRMTGSPITLEDLTRPFINSSSDDESIKHHLHHLNYLDLKPARMIKLTTF